MSGTGESFVVFVHIQFLFTLLFLFRRISSAVSLANKLHHSRRATESAV